MLEALFSIKKIIEIPIYDNRTLKKDVEATAKLTIDQKVQER